MSSSASPAPTSDGQLLGDFEVAITGGVWVAAGAGATAIVIAPVRKRHGIVLCEKPDSVTNAVCPAGIGMPSGNAAIGPGCRK